MKIQILNIPSQPPGNNLRLIDASNPDVLEFHQENADWSFTDWTISRADFLAAPELPWPDAIPLVTVTNDEMKQTCVEGHWWIANGTWKGIKVVLEGAACAA